MHDLSIFGTSSDAGKSTLAFALTYLLHHRGIKVAPFKAQNVSNNAKVCDAGGEIAEAQYFAAESIEIPTTPLMNPVLLKSGKDNSSSLIVKGETMGSQTVRDYYKDIGLLKPVVKEAFEALKQHYECIVAEGAGSPVELNLMDKDLSNIYIATQFQTKIILVADIERGGVFASIWGVYNLLPKELQANVIGVIVNKFRGDMTLFDEGRTIIEKQFGIPVLGVVPYTPFNLGFEDIQSLKNYEQKSSSSLIRVGVIALPHMSNFTDMEPLIADDEVDLAFITTLQEAKGCDLIIVPGSKRVMHDLQWLKDQGFQAWLERQEVTLLAICGGFEMLFEELHDPLAIESETAQAMQGLGLVEGSVTFEAQKVLKKGVYDLFGEVVQGYEMHHGHAASLSIQKTKLYGSFVHGLLDHNGLRTKILKALNSAYKGFDFQAYKKQKIAEFAQVVERSVDLGKIIKEIEA